MTRLGRRRFLAYGAAMTGSSLGLKACAPDLAASTRSEVANPTDDLAAAQANADEGDEITIGLLHSLSGSLAMSEAPLIDAELLAIEEINAGGGLLGKQLVPIQEDGASDWPTFAEKAEKLIAQYGVATIFGGYTTASRKAMLPVLTSKNRLLWYPGAYEGQECSRYVFYMGPTANQHIEPALNWMLGNRGKSFFLISSGDRITHDIAKAFLRNRGGKVAGESFVPLTGSAPADMLPVIAEIKQALPEGGIIFNSLVGNHNRLFLKSLYDAGLSASRYLVMSVRLGEEDVFQIGKPYLEGHYAANSYFQTLVIPENEAFVSRFKTRFGADRVVGGAMCSAYTMMYLWAQAVEKAQSADTSAVRAAAYGQSYQSPGGLVTIRPNHHLAQIPYIGQASGEGLFDLRWRAETAIEPNPWSQQIPSGNGFACDWTDNERGEKYSVREAQAL
ncbi:MAG: transporter substrate-binding protein [Cyanobacteria bacterium J06643_4]